MKRSETGNLVASWRGLFAAKPLHHTQLEQPPRTRNVIFSHAFGRTRPDTNVHNARSFSTEVAGNTIGDKEEAGLILQLYDAYRKKDVKRVLSVMAASRTSATLQGRACDILNELVTDLESNADFREHIWKGGGIPLIIAALSAHQKDPLAVEAACALLGRLAMDVSIVPAIVKAGGLETIIRAIAANPGNTAVHLQGFCALTSVAVNDDNVSIKLGSMGVISAALNAMRRERSTYNVQFAGCCLLGALATQDTNLELIVQDAGIKTILTSISQCKEHSHVVQNALICVSRLASKPQHAAVIMKENGIRLVVDAMKTHADDNAVLERGCEALGVLAVCDKAAFPGVVHNGAQFSTRIAQEGAISIIVQALDLYQSLAELQAMGVWALGNMSVDKMVGARITKEGGTQAILNAMKAHPDSAQVQESGCLALGTLSAAPDNAKTIVKLGGIEVLTMVIRTHLPLVDTAKWAIENLRMHSGS